jgi:copper homeostasis protein CutC
MSELINDKTSHKRKAGIMIGATVNMGNFENFKLEISIDDVTRPGETWDEAINRIYVEAQDQLISKVRQTRRMMEEG